MTDAVERVMALADRFVDAAGSESGHAEEMADIARSALRAAVEALAASAQPAGWRPIETAPKDGTHVLVWPPTWNGLSSCARWDADEYAKRPRPLWRRNDDLGRVLVSRGTAPTHWMPLPAPPTPAAVQPPDDAARFRWLDEHALTVDMVADPDNLVQVWCNDKAPHRGRTLRDAVDAAMAAEVQPEAEPTSDASGR